MEVKHEALRLSLEDKLVYTADRIRSGLHHIRLTFVVFIILYGLFAVLDYLLVGDYFSTFLIIRFGIVIPLMFVSVVLSFLPSFYKFAQPLMVLCCVAGGSGIAYMLILYPENFSYYGGIFLVIFAGYFLIRLDTQHALFGGLFTLFFYVTGYAWHYGTLNMETLMVVLFFLGANIIGALGNYQMERIGQANFLHKREIHRQNEQLYDRVQEQKTELLQVEKAIDSTSDAVVIFNPLGDITYHNAAYKSLTRLYSFPDMRVPQLFEDILANVLTGETWEGERTVSDNMGVKKVLLIHADAIPGKSGVIVGIVTTCRDITIQKQAEGERQQLQMQLIHSQKMESVGRLAGGVAHDFNNMLGVILGHAELALQSLDASHPLYNSMQNIRKAADRSADLTRQLLAFARKQTVAPKVLSLNETVEEMLDMLQRLIGENINLIWIPEPSIGNVRIDPSQIDQILANLCINARDAIADTGSITIETGNITIDETTAAGKIETLPGQYITLTISDSGCGMDTETLSHIFEPFFTTKGVGKGTGLGLATVYGIVKQNKGFIDFQSEPGKGTTFKICLPCCDGEKEQPRANTTATTLRGIETILLVEDEVMILKMTTKVLEKLGYQVFAYTSPLAAISFAKQYSDDIHLLLTDVIMPEMNGRDLANQMQPHFPELKCLFMSGYTADVIAHHGILDKGIFFIQKPFTRSDLSLKVRDALGHRSG